MKHAFKTFDLSYPENNKTEAPASGDRKILYHVFDGALTCSDVILNAMRVVVGYAPALILLYFTIIWTLIIISFGPGIIRTLDTFYEVLRPILLETLLQVLNFARVVFAAFVGVYNAGIDVVMLPIRVFFDSVLSCTQSERFVQNVVATIVELTSS